MNVLQKILEEIDSHAIEFESFGMCDDYVSVGWIKEIIRSNMEDYPTADEEEKFILCTLDENGTLSEYDDKYDVVIHCSSKKDQDETIKIIEDSNWIPVSERLPENDDYILLSFENFSIPEIGRYEQDEEGGAFYPGDEDYTYLSYGLFVNAWKPLPKPYKKERDYE